MRPDCLPNSLPAYFSMMAISVPHVLGGNLYCGNGVHSYPGLGALPFESARYAAYNLLMVLRILTGALVILCSMVAQGINQRIDPRRVSGGGAGVRHRHGGWLCRAFDRRQSNL